ncbi:hypothetical protein QJQ45_027466 [Haematococcus lacustris]|nr:hypothetical protein QJQ45_027466 [Haematococcus lacustris]
MPTSWLNPSCSCVALFYSSDSDESFSQYAAKKRAVQAAKAPSQAKSNTQKELKVTEQLQKRVKRKAKAGVKALREIREYQKSVKLLIPKAPMRRLIRGITETFGGDVIDRWTSSALEAVQEVAEAYMVSSHKLMACSSLPGLRLFSEQVAYFERSQLAAIHGKRITIMPKDMDLVKRMAVDL